VTLPGDRSVAVAVDTEYPADGHITIRVLRSPDTAWTLSLRIPHWAREATVRVAGESRVVGPGWATIQRRFAAGDLITLELPVRPRLTWPDPRIDAVRGCAAVERGPVVLCAESVDLPAHVPLDALRLIPTGDLTERAGTVVAAFHVASAPSGPWPYTTREPVPPGDRDPIVEIPLRPYHDWASRGPSTMRIWLPAPARPGDSPGP
jgi:DUF1680 family protein